MELDRQRLAACELRDTHEADSAHKGALLTEMQASHEMRTWTTAPRGMSNASFYTWGEWPHQGGRTKSQFILFMWDSGRIKGGAPWFDG
jgi:hypothetical protein